MIAYWILLLLPTISSLDSPRRRWSFFESILIFLCLAVFIGLRHDVGGDWDTYITYSSQFVGTSLLQGLTIGDISYALISWIFSSAPGAIYLTNLVCASIFSACLVSFCSRQPRPSLALCLSTPYLIIVISMGYTRQSVAIGLILLALTFLYAGRNVAFLLTVAIACSFHSTALMTMGFLLPAIQGKTWISRLLRVSVIAMIIIVFLRTYIEARIGRFFVGYIDFNYQSDGALIRVLSCLIPALLFILVRSRFKFLPRERLTVKAMCVGAFACAALLVFLPNNTTAVDRISLYLIPLQIIVGSHLPDTHFLGLKSRQLVVITLLYCILTQFVWLSFANHAYLWIPYRNLLFN